MTGADRVIWHTRTWWRQAGVALAVVGALSVGSASAGAAEPTPSWQQLPTGEAPCPEGQSRSSTLQQEGFERSIPQPRFNDGWSQVTTVAAAEGSRVARSTLSGSSSDPTDYFYLQPVRASGPTWLAFASRGTQGTRSAVVASNSVAVSVAATTSWAGSAVDLTQAATEEGGWLTTWFEQSYVSGRSTAWDVDNVQIFTCRLAQTTRISGADRYAVSAAIADTYPVGAPVFVARGDSYADALAAVPLAARERGPVLLVRPDEIPTAVSAALTRLRPARIVILGGTVSVTPTVAARLATFTTGATTRIEGPDRYAVAARVSEQFAAGLPEVYVASGQGFADALSGAPLAARGGAPLLLTVGTAVPADTAAALTRLAPGRIVVLGGPATISEATLASLATFASGGAERISGTDRYAVSAAVAARFPRDTAVSYLATGVDFPDSITGAAAAGAGMYPLLLSNGLTLPTSVRAALDTLTDRSGVVVGGPASVPAIVRDLYGRTLP